MNGVDGLGNVAPDASLQRTFLTVNSTSIDAFFAQNAIEAFDNNTYLLSATIPVNFAATEGSQNPDWTIPDLLRWGQDGLAALTDSGHIYLFRGAAIVPQLLNQNTAATLTSSSTISITHGAGNTLLTLTGSNFVPGVAVSWNGSYRTTTIISPTHITVANPASDLASTGTASLVATNPGAPASSAITITLN